MYITLQTHMLIKGQQYLSTYCLETVELVKT